MTSTLRDVPALDAIWRAARRAHPDDHDAAVAAYRGELDRLGIRVASLLRQTARPVIYGDQL